MLHSDRVAQKRLARRHSRNRPTLLANQSPPITCLSFFVTVVFGNLWKFPILSQSLCLKHCFVLIKLIAVFLVLFIIRHSAHAPSTAGTLTRVGSNAEARKRRGAPLLTAIPQTFKLILCSVAVHVPEYSKGVHYDAQINRPNNSKYMKPISILLPRDFLHIGASQQHLCECTQSWNICRQPQHVPEAFLLKKGLPPKPSPRNKPHCHSIHCSY